ncbi:hypothetical protein [Planococcus shixiaomingii]|uniref:hypothetical protein n=1 Tax=Planococcus shixiaomingii TaxID=3058393 RepID=UPI002633FE6F|nr:hypothetical protein [Planococcus sp. N022]WKA56813.1 hypothetical protein QWY21_19530 [Planococcus sp. N022]
MNEKIIVPDLYVESKKAVAAYQNEVQLLDAQEDELNAELELLQQELTQNIMDQEGANVSDRVYLRMRGKEISVRADIINSVLAELEEERHELKLKYVPIFGGAMAEDSKGKPSYSAKVQEIMDCHLYTMLEEIADMSEQLRQQHDAISSGLNAVYQDSKVNEVHRNIRYRQDWERSKPNFYTIGKSVLDRYHVDAATNGYIHGDFKNKKPAKEATGGE